MMSAPPGCKDECGVGSKSPSFTKPFTACENPYENSKFKYMSQQFNGLKLKSLQQQTSKFMLHNKILTRNLKLYVPYT